MRYILASKSPRRRELLSELVESFEIITAEVDETLPDSIHPRDGVEMLAIRKGEVIAKENADAVVISSDTLVEIGGVALGKPKDKADAFSMLKLLSGKAHNVHTGVAVHYNGKCFSGVASTAVYFREMTDEEINAYIDSGDPMDKAGSYGIQGKAALFASGIEGDYFNVMGLPLHLVGQMLREFNVDLFSEVE